MFKVQIQPEQVETFRTWRKEIRIGGVPILKKVRPRGKYVVALICIDDRFVVNASMRLTELCQSRESGSDIVELNGSLCPITLVGGALALRNDDPNLELNLEFVKKQVIMFLRVKHVPLDAPVDVLAMSHTDCGYATMMEMGLTQQMVALEQACANLAAVLPSPRFETRPGWHMYWPELGSHRTYELNLAAAREYLARGATEDRVAGDVTAVPVTA